MVVLSKKNIIFVLMLNKKGIIALCLLFVVMLPCLFRVAVMSNYYVNLNKYKTEYCVNKATPKLHCDGGCQLAKELNSASEQSDNERPNFPKLNYNNGFYFIEVLDLLQEVPSKFVTLHHTESKVMEIPYLGSIFHPPQLV